MITTLNTQNLNFNAKKIIQQFNLKMEDNGKCPFCDIALIEDEINGNYICRGCGFVSASAIYEINRPRIFENTQEKIHYSIETNTYKPITISSNDLSQMAQHKKSAFRRQIRLGNFCNNKERKDLLITNMLTECIRQLELPNDVFYASVNLYNRLYRSGVLKDKKTILIIGAIIDLTCHMLNFEIRINDIVNAINTCFESNHQIKRGDVGRMKNKLLQLLPKENSIINTNMRAPITIKEQMNAHFRNIRRENIFDEKKLINLEQITQQLYKHFIAVGIINEIQSDKLNYASGIIFIAIKLRKYKMSASTLSQYIGLSSSTIRNHYNILCNYLPIQYKELIMKKN